MRLAHEQPAKAASATPHLPNSNREMGGHRDSTGRTLSGVLLVAPVQGDDGPGRSGGRWARTGEPAVVTVHRMEEIFGSGGTAVKMTSRQAENRAMLTPLAERPIASHRRMNSPSRLLRRFEVRPYGRRAAPWQSEDRSCPGASRSQPVQLRCWLLQWRMVTRALRLVCLARSAHQPLLLFLRPRDGDRGRGDGIDG